MIVDDVEISNFILKKMISKVPGNYLIYDYTSPEEALADIEKINPDLIFLDLNMPVIDGWEFLSLMNEKKHSQVVYILTSSSSELDHARSRNYINVKDFLVKPLNVNTLAHILEGVFESTKSNC